MSETSTPYTPASTITFGNNETVSLADEVKKYKTEALIDFLRKEEDLSLNDDDFEIIRKRKIVDPHPIDENSKEFKLCIDDILRRIKNIGPVVDSNEAMRCEYISTILHTAVSILEGLVILPQMNVSGEESSGCVDYAIKKVLEDLLEEIICITEGKQNQPGKEPYAMSKFMNLDTLKKKRTADEAFEEYEYVYGIVTTATDWYFILHSTEAIYCTSKTEYRISLTEDALKDSTDLRKNMKRILEVIVGLLRNRVSASE
ncbi:hypothetical protein C1646_768554 [Rhizophagus diaphanus]|nr:hypothetical protein C1646_768554 [Rhizophagus diaphanus] [Rhizophagus sp. MUCL 43196]